MTPEDHRIDWDDLDLSTADKLHKLALRLEQDGQGAVADAIARHKEAGNPVYFGDPADPDVLVKELPDGTRFQVEFGPDGSERVVRRLPGASSAAE